MDVEPLLNDAEEPNGDGHRTRHAQGGSQETLTAADQNDGAEALDQAKPSERRIYVAKEARHQKIQKRPARARLTRQGVMEKSYRVVGNAGHWAVAEDGAEPAGDYATREGAVEAIYLAGPSMTPDSHPGLLHGQEMLQERSGCW
jgi:hypothetical protein